MRPVPKPGHSTHEWKPKPMTDDKPVHITFRAQNVPEIEQDPAETTTDVTVMLSIPDAQRLIADLSAAIR